MGGRRRLFYLFHIILLFFSLHDVHANKITDSLEVRFILVDEVEKTKILNILADLYIRNKPQEAQKKSIQAYEKAEALHLNAEKAYAIRNLGLIYSQLVSDHDTALYLCTKALAIEKEVYPEGSAKTQMAMSDIYQNAGDNIRALQHLFESVRISDSIQNQELRVNSRLKLANVYYELEDNANTIETLRSSLKIAKLEGHSILEGKCLMELGGFYLEEGNYLLAHENFLLAQEKFTNVNHPDLRAQNLYYLGECNRFLNNYKRSHELFSEALTIRQENEDTRGIAETYIKLGALQKDLGNYVLAKNWLNKGLAIAEMINSNHLMRECYNLLFYVYTELGDFENASYYNTRFASISEQIYTEIGEQKYLEHVTQHEIQSKQQELTLLSQEFESQKLELQKRRTFNFALITILLLLISIGGIIYYSYREKKKINKKLQETNKMVLRQNHELRDLNMTKDKFFSIIGHDLKGPINSLTAFSELLANGASTMSEVELKTIATELNKSLKTLHALLENLLTWARSQTGRIELKPVQFDINEIILETLQLLNKSAENKEIVLNYSSRSNTTVWADKNAIKTVLRNLVSNAIKFTNRGGEIWILVDQYKDAIEVSIKDTGVGMTQSQMQSIFDISIKRSTPGTDKEKGTGLGLILCKEFVEKNGGKILVESKQNEGTTFRFTVPNHG